YQQVREAINQAAPQWLTAQQSTRGRHYVPATKRAVSVAVLVHGGAAAGAQIALLALQAGRDRADVGDLAGTEAIDIGRAGAALFRRALKSRGRSGAGQ